MTMAEMAEKALAAANQPPLDPKTIETAQLWAKAQQGDADSIRKLVDSSLPQAQPAKPAPGSVEERMLQQQEEINALKNQLGFAVATAQEIQYAKDMSVVSNAINTFKEKLPYTSKHPQGVQMVAQAMKGVADWKRREVGRNQLTQQEMSDATLAALAYVEKNIADTVALYGVQPTAPQPTRNGIPNDQGAILKSPGSIPSQYVVQNGRYVPNPAWAGNTPGGPVNGTVPEGVPPASGVRGSAVGPGTSPTNTKPFTRADLDRQIAQRRQQQLEGHHAG